MDKCYAKVGGIEPDSTRRGCFSGDDNPNDKFFKICTSDNCNTQVVPDHRIKCFQCDEKSNANCPISGSNYPPLRFCQKYNTNASEECYVILDKKTNKIRRGCVTDLEYDEKECEDGICEICDFDGCNRVPKYRNPSLFCVKCESSSDRNNSCLWGHEFNVGESCTNTVEFGTQELCFTSIGKDGGVKRGCLNDQNTNVCENNSCETCFTASCNRQNIVKQSCVICNSTTTPSCAETNPGIEMQECPTLVQTFDERWCYTYRDTRDRSVHRGCLSEVTQELRTTCLQEKQKVCEICDTLGCNDKMPPNSSSRPMISVFLIITVTLFFI